MTLDERYKVQKKKNERLNEKLSSLEFESEMRDAGVKKELETLRRLMQETELLREEFKKDLQMLKEYKNQYELLVASLREFKSGLEERFGSTDQQWVVDHGSL